MAHAAHDEVFKHSGPLREGWRGLGRCPVAIPQELKWQPKHYIRREPHKPIVGMQGNGREYVRRNGSVLRTTKVVRKKPTCQMSCAARKTQ